MRQHFYTRHNIRLLYPHLKCVVEQYKSGHERFIPIELIEIIHDSNQFDEDLANKFIEDWTKELEMDTNNIRTSISRLSNSFDDLLNNTNSEM